MFEKLGRFEIKKVLGQGAMGEVYLGVDPALGREVAIKTILPAAGGTGAAGDESKARFAREAKAAGILNHPNLVTIYEFGEDQGVLYIAMEYVRGHDLEELLRQQALTRSEALEVLAQVCDGLAFAHHNGIIHRDIKPSNVRVLRDGKRLHAKVMDFGVARFGNSDMTATGMVMGTVSYMAPEYIRTGVPDPRSDLFAIGVMLYEALSGRKPFAGDTTPTILYRIVNDPPDPLDLSELKDISPAVRSVLDRALDKDPERRHPGAEELAKALRAAKDPTWMGQALDGTTRIPSAEPAAATTALPAADATALLVSPPALPVAAPLPAPRPAPRRANAAGWAAAAGALLLVGVAGFAAWRSRATQPQAGAGSTPVAAAPAGQDPSSQLQPAAPAVVPLPVAATAVAGRPAQPRREAPEPAPAVNAALPVSPLGEADDLSHLEAPERRNLGLQLLSEATALRAQDPARALQLLDRAIAANPHDPRPFAWSAAILYGQQRFEECREVLRRAEAAGHSRGALAACNDAFRRAMDTDSFNHRLDRAPR